MEATKLKKRNKINFGEEKLPARIEHKTDSELYEFSLEFLSKEYPGKILYSLKETADILNLSEDFVSSRILKNKITTSKFGNRSMINKLTLAKLISQGVN